MSFLSSLFLCCFVILFHFSSSPRFLFNLTLYSPFWMFVTAFFMFMLGCFIAHLHCIAIYESFFFCFFFFLSSVLVVVCSCCLVYRISFGYLFQFYRFCLARIPIFIARFLPHICFVYVILFERCTNEGKRNETEKGSRRHQLKTFFVCFL